MIGLLLGRSWGSLLGLANESIQQPTVAGTLCFAIPFKHFVSALSPRSSERRAYHNLLQSGNGTAWACFPTVSGVASVARAVAEGATLPFRSVPRRKDFKYGHRLVFAGTLRRSRSNCLSLVSSLGLDVFAGAGVGAPPLMRTSKTRGRGEQRMPRHHRSRAG